MRLIQKAAEPGSLVGVRTDPLTNLHNSSSARCAFDQNDKATLRQALVAEQGYLCAFCMRRIDATPTTRIAHLVPIDLAPELALTWSNLFGSCQGDAYPSGSTCDVAQGNTRLSIDPGQPVSIAKLHYESRPGRDAAAFVTSCDAQARADVDAKPPPRGNKDQPGTLNLNGGDLPELRYAAWKAFQSRVRENVPGKYGKPAGNAYMAKWLAGYGPRLPPMLGYIEWKLR